LESIQKKINEKQYQNPQNFKQDIDLYFENYLNFFGSPKGFKYNYNCNSIKEVKFEINEIFNNLFNLQRKKKEIIEDDILINLNVLI
jgi:hypothetical protein